MFRRTLAVLLLLLPLLPLLPIPAQAFGLDEVDAMARRAAASPWQAAAAPLPEALRSLDYDGLRAIRYRPERALWREQGLPFELQLFHRGGGQAERVELHEVAQGAVRRLAYDPSAWTFGPHRVDAAAWGDLGHAGFRVHAALNSPAYRDELIVFLGASYFRALGRGQQYGLSARGLAVDTVGGPAGEEFPRFTAFWVHRPAPGDAQLTIDALMESPRLAGAYRFVVRPGDSTRVEVEARIHLRAGTQPPAMLGIAPLTSMFLHGENQPSASDFRPEVHDSDGLLVAAGRAGGATEWLWRPLFNPPRPLASSFEVERLQGFGLMQRDRRFSAYEDTEARYERRPSVWVEPIGDWGPGRVQLLLLPTPDETHDNVAATWVPARLPAPGQPLVLSWRLHWQGEALQQPPGAWTVQSRRGHGWLPADPAARPRDELKFTIDFDGPALRALPADAAPEVVASLPQAGRARITEARTWRHPEGGFRVLLRVQRPEPQQPLELRVYLRRGDAALSETWASLVPPDAPSTP